MSELSQTKQFEVRTRSEKWRISNIQAIRSSQPSEHQSLKVPPRRLDAKGPLSSTTALPGRRADGSSQVSTRRTVLWNLGRSMEATPRPRRQVELAPERAVE